MAQNYRQPFPIGDASLADTISVNCSELRINDYVILKDRPCKIFDILKSKPNKRVLKVLLVGFDIFTGKKYEDLHPPTFTKLIPNVLYKEYQLLDISHDGFALIFDKEFSDTRDDIKLPENGLGKEIRENLEADEALRVTILKSMGEEQIESYKIESISDELETAN